MNKKSIDNNMNTKGQPKSFPSLDKIGKSSPRVTSGPARVTSGPARVGSLKKKISLSHSKVDAVKVDDDIEFLFEIAQQTNNYEHKEEKCNHDDTINENGIDVCTSCGLALYDKINNEAEWRYYGDNDNQHSSDPSRCQ